jgi:hypothetical protein
MCEWIVSSLIVGFVNVGPGVYTVQRLNDEQQIEECVIYVTSRENDKNL